MDKREAYIAALELAIRALDSSFVRANAAEVLRPIRPVSELWQMPPAQRAAAERAETAHYDVPPDHWGARLALMSAFEALHAALRVIASQSAHDRPSASAWRDAAGRAREATRLALEATAVFEEASLPPVAPTPQPTVEHTTATTAAHSELLSIR